MGGHLTEGEHMRRAEAIRVGCATGQPMSRIAAGLGMSTRALYMWYERHGERLAGAQPDTYARRSVPVPPSDRLRVERAGDGWLVECGPCGRRWARPTRRRAHDLAGLHLRMHRPRPAPPPHPSRPVRPAEVRAVLVEALRPTIGGTDPLPQTEAK